MPEERSGKPRFALTTRRIEALADCIFAFAMTLLVLTLTLPDATQTKLNLSQLLAEQWPKVFHYALRFFRFMSPYACWHHRLVDDDLGGKTFFRGTLPSCIFPGVAAVSMIVALFTP